MNAEILKMVTRMVWKSVPQVTESLLFSSVADEKIGFSNMQYPKGQFRYVQGAATPCYVALHPDLKGVTGKYFADCNEFEPSALARDAELGKKLWDFSNKLVDSASPV